MTVPPGPVRESRGRVLLSVIVQPGARRDEVAGLHDGRLRLRVTAPPEGGKANDRVIELVARLLGLRRVDVALAAGGSSRRKELALSGISLEEARQRVGVLLDVAIPGC